MLRSRSRARERDRLVTQPYRVLASTVFGVVLLAILGTAMGPVWDPVPLTDPLVVASSDTRIGGAPDELPRYAVHTSIVSVELDGATVQAQLSEPVGAPQPRAGVVFVHGAGTGSYTQAFVAQARALARAGVVTLVPNKRLDTYTTRHRDYVAMAGDYERSVDLLRSVPGVDPDRVGLYAESEGAWIAPVMAADDERIAFAVLVSAPVVPPRQQAAFAADNYLRNTRVPHGVFRAIPRAVGMAVPGGGFEYVDFDVTPYQRRMTQPILMVYGTGDASMPVVQGAEQVIRDVAIAGNNAVTVRYYADASHGIRVDGEIVPAFLQDLPAWVAGLPDTARALPKVAGAQPRQDFYATPVPEPRWMSDGDLVFAAIGGAAALLALCGAAVLVARGVEAVRVRRPHDTPVTVRRYARGVAPSASLLGAGAVATVVGLIWYIVAIARLALDYAHNDWVVKGGWIAVRVLGVAVVFAAVLLFRSVRRAVLSQTPVAPGITRLTALVVAGTCSAVLLVILAYWGVYQLGI